MQVSNDELVRISQYVESRSHTDSSSAWVRVDSLGFHGRYASSLVDDDVTAQNEVERVAELVAKSPDTRDSIVSSLRERIESGTYSVDGDSIAEMMVRRSLADRLR